MEDNIEQKFRVDLYKKYEGWQKHLIPKDVYNSTIEKLKLASVDKTSKTRHEYYILQKYEILQCGDVEKLIKKRNSPEEPPLYYINIEDTFDIIKCAHIATGHGGRDKMYQLLSDMYANITKDALGLYKSYCMPCQEKQKRLKAKCVVARPILTQEFGSRAQVDLIDMQSTPCGQYKWMFVYQCHLTKFTVIRALTSERASEVAYQLMDVFLLFGAPCILQSDNGSEFTAEVTDKLKIMWPSFKLVHRKPRHPQSQGSVERANGEIKDMLAAWLSDNNTQDWSIGIHFVQHQKNTSYHSGIKTTPYQALFGCKPKVGLTSMSLPEEVINRLEKEKDLLAVLKAGVPEESSPNSVSDSLAASFSSNFAATSSAIDADNASVSLEIDPNTLASDATTFNPFIDSDVLKTPSDLKPTHLARVEESSDAPQHESNMDVVLEAENKETSGADTVPSYIISQQNHIEECRKRARIAQLSLAERMVKRSRTDLRAGEMGNNVAIPIPLVDRGRGDPHNILGVILSRNENDLYTIAVKDGVLKQKYSRNEFDLCPKKLLNLNDVNGTTQVSLREALKKSGSGGQHFSKTMSNKKMQMYTSWYFV